MNKYNEIIETEVYKTMETEKKKKHDKWEEVKMIQRDVRAVLEDSDYSFLNVLLALDMLKVDIRLEAESCPNFPTMKEIKSAKTVSFE